MYKYILLGCLNLGFFYSCNQVSQNIPGNSATTFQKEADAIACAPANSLLESEMKKGVHGFGKHRQLKLSGSSNQLNILLSQFNVVPHLGFKSWAPFIPYGDSAMVIGNIIVTESDFPLLQQEATGLGFEIKDIHKYASRLDGVIVFSHIIGSGSSTDLSARVNQLNNQLRNGDKISNDEHAKIALNDLNINLIDSIIGSKGELAGDVYKFTFNRPNVIRSYGIPAGIASGFQTWAAWQGTNELAVVTGEIAMLEDEVAPVIKTMASNGFEGVTVHNHPVYYEPRIFFLHYWGVGNARQLAKGLRLALNEQK